MPSTCQAQRVKGLWEHKGKHGSMWGMGKLQEERQPTPGYIFGENCNLKRYTYIPMFTVALFTIARTWKQLKCPLTEERIKKIWCIYTMEYYSAIRKNEIMPFAETRMGLEIAILSEVSQTEKDKYHMIIAYTWNLKKHGINEPIYKPEIESQM